MTYLSDPEVSDVVATVNAQPVETPTEPDESTEDSNPPAPPVPVATPRPALARDGALPKPAPAGGGRPNVDPDDGRWHYDAADIFDILNEWG